MARTKGLMWAVIAAVIFLAIGATIYLDHRNCVCYTTRHFPGKTISFDEKVMHALADSEANNDTIRLLTIECKHGYNIILRVVGSDSYSAQFMQ